MKLHLDPQGGGLFDLHGVGQGNDITIRELSIPGQKSELVRQSVVRGAYGRDAISLSASASLDHPIAEGVRYAGLTHGFGIDLFHSGRHYVGQ